jgi:hypothetical protein
MPHTEKTITFTRTTEREVSFEDWYEEVKAKYATEEEAEKVWNKMCDTANTAPQHKWREIDNCEEMDWFMFEEVLEELEGDATDEITGAKSRRLCETDGCSEYRRLYTSHCDKHNKKDNDSSDDESSDDE